MLKGAKHREVDEYERIANQAVAHAKAANARKRITPKNIFDANKAHRMVDDGFDNWKNVKQPNRTALRKLKEAFKGFTPDFKKKGG